MLTKKDKLDRWSTVIDIALEGALSALLVALLAQDIRKAAQWKDR